ncbi:MAG TPA: radical SAM protein [Alphaproteobacteria bacterium]|nr:radical SAM protein [Alphaproteobacteria bacterium]
MSTLTVTSDHFAAAVPAERARELFKSSVDQIEIEVFSYCNRVCWFCPNSHIDRRSANRYMDEALYLRILDELRSIAYGGVVTYSRYNEPLADRIILTRLRQARERLPEATLYTHTNGDYLTRELLDELREAGLNVLRVQVYLGNDEHFDDAAMLTRMARRLGDLGLPFEFTDVLPNTRYMARVSYPGIEVTFDARNFDRIGTDRGQTVKLARPYRRTAPCFVVYRHLYIDWNGAVVPCCNIRSDEPSHRPYIVDDLSGGRSIFDAYANSALAAWRRELLRFGDKRKPCDTCFYEVPADSAELRQTTEALARRFGLA